MAQNSAYYPQQQPPQQQYSTHVYPQSQPQNIYQQLGKPQPQPHLQEHPIYQQSSALVVQPQGGYLFSQQLPAQVQTSFPLGEAPHAPPQTSYQLEKPHVPPQTPYPQSQTPYLPSQPPYAQSQASYPVSQQPYSSLTPYQQAQYPGQQQSQQAYSSHSQLQVSHVPQTSFTSQTPAAVPTSSSGSSWRVPASWPPPVAHSATLAQQAQSQVQTQVQPQATSQTLALAPAQKKPLPQPFTVANATILPFTSQPADNPFPTLAIQAPSSNSSSPKRGRPLPTPTVITDKQATVDLGRLPHMFSSSLAISAFSTQSSISSQPQPITTKCTSSSKTLPAPSSYNPLKKVEWNKFSGLPAAVTTIPKSILTTTSSSISTTSATTLNSTSDTSSQSQPQPIFRNRTPSPSKSSLPAPSSHNSLKKSEWNKFSGLPAVSTIPKSISTTTSTSISTPSATTSNSTSYTSEPPPKKSTPIWKQTLPSHPAPAWGYAVGMVSKPYPKPKAKVPTPGSTSFIKSGVQKRYTYQQQQQAYSGHAGSPATYSENQDEDEEDSKEDSEEETDSDEEDEQPDLRYNPQNKRRKYIRPMASKLITSRAGVPSQTLSRVNDRNIKEGMIFTPKRKLRLRPKVKKNKMDPYTAYKVVNTANGQKSRIVPRRGRDDISVLEEGSNDSDQSEYGHRQLPNHRRVQVPRINVANDPSSSRPPPRIQVNGSGPSIPSINPNSSPLRMNRIINYDSGPIINIEPPTINVDGGDSPRRGWPNISVSGHAARNLHHAQSALQQLRFRGRRTHGRQVRPAGGLICGGCNGSIIGRIVSAMGSRWHPACFCCTVCNELLEHVSSYEHEGQPYCHLDYHENFAPRCYSCKTAIIEEQFISLDDPALGKRTYHTQHFFCAECGDPFLPPSVSFSDSIGEVALCGDGEFEGFTVYKGHPYCEACHVLLRLPKCKRCKRSIRDHDEAVEALGGKWCWECFVCATCKEPFENPSFFQRGDKPFCEPCFSIMLRNQF